MTSALGEHFFRHEFGRLVAMLSRRAGVQHLELVEDAVQVALLAAVESWTRTFVPANPSAWLYRVAHNHLLGELRRRTRRDELTGSLVEHSSSSIEEPAVLLSGDVPEAQLRMLFVCCDDSIAIESQLMLALRTLCGFDISEIAQRLFTSETNVYKRLGRARSRLRETRLVTDEMSTEQLASRLPAVHAILYTLFTEGYLSSHAEYAIRRELCDEARRLTALLAAHPVAATPETFALLALMHLHIARMSARQDGSGGLVLLEEQDRSQFDREEIVQGLSWLARSATGDVFSRYHAEAGIAAEHCLAPSFSETRWDRIVECYELLDRLAPSAIHTLNRALAVAECTNAAAGLAVIEGIEPPSWLTGSYLWSAVLADLNRRGGRNELAKSYRDTAIELAPSPAIAACLRRRLA
ncbi:MAG TPA: sigma-70 family RNA polymerase sigma factor [Polyangiaceae bacterium]|nr:sigma-70 family RNA polymerase sigma factor [Polyangiaceae bacterium]